MQFRQEHLRETAKKKINNETVSHGVLVYGATSFIEATSLAVDMSGWPCPRHMPGNTCGAS